MSKVLTLTGSHLLALFSALGAALSLLGRSLQYCRLAFANRTKVINQMYFVGVQSVPVVITVALFTGMVLALQSGVELARFGKEAFIGELVGSSMVREMGPVWTAVILAARVGSAMAAELGTMKISEEVDALEVMTINPLRYLVMPRLLAMIIMAPILTLIADAIGIIGGGVIGDLQFQISTTVYIDHVRNAIHIKDFVSGFVKSVVFAMTIVTIACYRGLTTRNGAEGVGQAATSTVVTSFLFVLLFDYFITNLFYT